MSGSGAVPTTCPSLQSVPHGCVLVQECWEDHRDQSADGTEQRRDKHDNVGRQLIDLGQQATHIFTSEARRYTADMNRAKQRTTLRTNITTDVPMSACNSRVSKWFGQTGSSHALLFCWSLKIWAVWPAQPTTATLKQMDRAAKASVGIRNRAAIVRVWKSSGGVWAACSQ